MATNKITYTLDFKANFKDVEGQLNTLKKNLNSVIGMKMNPTKGMSAEIKAAADAAMSLKGHMAKALDPNTGKLDLSRLQVQLKASGQSAGTLMNNLLQGGKQGAEAFLQVGNAIVNAQKPMHRFSTLSKELWVTLKNTAKWQISSYALTSMTSAFSNALTFVKELDKSLNDIRIVTGDSREQMERFAVAANKTAKALSTTTKRVADATLIYRQQGDTAEEAAKKAEITIKAANASRTEAQEMSEYLTGIWNSYQVGAESLELFADKLVKVGAVTATSAEELATSMTKVAATANTVGVSYDQLLSTIATVSSATRVSAEQIGTAFKTIYARMGDLELKGSIDEDGVTTTLGTVSSSLKQVGVNVLDAQGNIRDMGLVIEDLGTKWQTMTLNEKTAIAEAVAGKRQYTQLFALFDNWDEYQRTLKEAGDAQGELNKQQAKYADSIEGAQARLKAAKEEFLLEGVSGETIQDLIDGLAYVVEGFNGATKAAGGLQPILMTLGGYLLTKFAPQISTKMVDMWGGFLSSIGLAEKNVLRLQREVEETFAKAKSNPNIANDAVAKSQLELMETQNKLQIEMTEKLKHYNAEQKESYNIQKQILEQAYEISNAEKMGAVDTAKQGVNVARKDVLKAGGKSSIDKNMFTSLQSAEGISPQMKSALNDLNHDFETGSLKVEEFIQKITRIDDATGELNLTQDDFTILSNVLKRTSADAETVQNALYELTMAEVEYQNAVKDATRNTEEHRQKLEALPGQIEAEEQARKDNIRTLEEEKQKLKELNKEKEKSGTTLKTIQDDLPNTSKSKKGGRGAITNKDLGLRGKGSSTKASQINKTIKSVKAGDLNTEEIQQALKNLEGASGDTAEKIRKNLQKAFDLTKIDNNIDKTKKKIEELDNTTKKGSFKTSASNTIKFAGALGQLGMSATMTTNSIKTLFSSSEDVSVFDRFMAVFMLLTSIMSTYQGAVALANTETGKQIALGIKNAFLKEGETAIEMKSTAAKWANVAATYAQKLAQMGLAGAIIAGVVAITAAIVAIVQLSAKYSQGAKDAKAFETAQKKLEELDEVKNTLEEEISALEDLSEKLKDTTQSATSLVEIEKQLNEVLGTNFDLLNGGSAELDRANAMIKARIKLKEEELEANRKEAAEQYEIQSRTVTAKTADRWFSDSDTMSNKQLQGIVKKIQNWDEERRNDFFAGKLGTETMQVEGMGMEEISHEAIAEAMQQNKEVTTKFAESFLENVEGPINDEIKKAAIKFADQGATGEEIQAFLNSYASSSAAIQRAFSSGDEKAFEEALSSLNIPEDMDKHFQEYSRRSLALLKETNAILSENEGKKKTASEIVFESTTGFRENMSSVQDIMSTFIEKQKLSMNDIATFIKDTENKLWRTEEEKELLTKGLLEAKTLEDVTKITSQLAFKTILNDEYMKKLLREGNFEEVERVLGESGVVNAKQIAEEWGKTEQHIDEIGKKFEKMEKDGELLSYYFADQFDPDDKDSITLTADAVEALTTEMEVLQSEYGYTKEAAEGLILTETIFNNQELNVWQKIDALKAYGKQIGFLNNSMNMFVNSDKFGVAMTDEAILEAVGATKGENGKWSFNGQEINQDNPINLLIAQEYYSKQAQKDYYVKISNKAEKERDKLIRDHNEAIEEWLKEDSLAKVEDRIEEFTLKITQKQREIDSIDWKLELFGESEEVGTYLQKAELMAEKASMLVDEFHKLTEMEPTSADEATAIASRMTEIYEEWMSVQREMIEQEQELTEQAATNLIEVLTKEYELIIATIEAMNTLLTINMNRGSLFSAEKEKNNLLRLLGQTLNNFTEEEKEHNKKIQAREKLNKELIALDQKMQDEIRELELLALQEGIKERETERQRELRNLKEDYESTLADLETTISTAGDNINNYLNPILDGLLNKISTLLNYDPSAKYSYNEFEDEKRSYNRRQTEDLKGLHLGHFSQNAETYEIVAIDYEDKRVTVAAKDANGKVLDIFDYNVANNDPLGGYVNAERYVGEIVDVGTEMVVGSDVYTEKYAPGDRRGRWSTFSGGSDATPSFSMNQNQKVTSGTNASASLEQFTKVSDSYGGGKLDGFLEHDGKYFLKLADGNSYGDEHYVRVNKKDYESHKKQIEKNGSTYAYGIFTEGHINEVWKKNYAKGSDSTPAGEAFVGEEGRELILLPDGKIVLAGQDGMELANLPQGARVLTNEETEEILRNKKDYANLVLSQTSKSGQKVTFERYEDGISDGLQSEDFITDTSDLSTEFYSEELEKQKEHDKDIEAELDKHNEQIETDEKQHNSNLETIAQNHATKEQNNLKIANGVIKVMTEKSAQEIESLINDMKLVMPEIDSQKFIESLEKLVNESLAVVYKDQNITITDEHGNTHTGKMGGSGGPAEIPGTGKIRGHSVEIGQGITTYDDLFTKYGEEYGIDPRFLKAVCGIETEYGKNINVSKAGAKGLMQFTDATARAYNVDVTDHDSSVRGAAEYLSRLLTIYHGNLVLAGRAYNAGTPNNSTENLEYGRMLEECFGQDTTNDQIYNGVSRKASTFIELLHQIARGTTSFVSENGWIDPVIGGWISSDYQPEGRAHPVLGITRGHYGIDISAFYGAPLYATKSGTIDLNTYDDGGYGNWVRIKTDDGYLVGYGHMMEPSKFKKGDRIEQGEIIGYMGATGLSSGAHLDYHVMKDGEYIDPKTIMPSYALGGRTKLGKALVGEYGREIILYPDGTAGLLGENGMEYANLPAGARIIPNQETERILGAPIDYTENRSPILGYANGTEFKWDKETIEEFKAMIFDGPKAQTTADKAFEIWNYYKNYDNLSKEEREQKNNELAARAFIDAQTIYESGVKALDTIIQKYQEYLLNGGTRIIAFETQIAEWSTQLGDNYDKAIDEWKKIAENKKEVFIAEWETIKDAETIIGSWDNEDELKKSIADLNKTLELFPKDINKISQSWSEMFSAAEQYMNSYLQEFNRQYQEKIELEEKNIARLKALKNLQESINDESNSYREALHDINKELSLSRLSSQWFDKTQKERIFNEKDYLALNQKITELQRESQEDWKKTQQEIDNLSDEELHQAQYINEAYKERAEIRNKELNILKEELNLQKKQNSLNEALMERNVRVFTGSGWKQIANIESVKKASEELAETKYQIETKTLEKEQAEQINTRFNEALRDSNSKIAEWNSTMEQASKNLKEEFRKLKGEVKVSNLSLKSFNSILDTIVKGVSAQRQRLQYYGIDTGKTKEDFENDFSYYEKGKVVMTIDGKEFTYADLLLLEKELWKNAKTDEERENSAKKAEEIRKAMFAEGGVAAEIAQRSKNWDYDDMYEALNRTLKDGLQKNFAGTRDSKSGFSLVNEKGVEMLSTKYGQLIELNPHQKIFNNDQMNFLYDLSREGISGMNRTIDSMTNNLNNSSLSIENLNIKLDNVTDANSFVNELQNLTQYLQNSINFNKSSL